MLEIQVFTYGEYLDMFLRSNRIVSLFKRVVKRSVGLNYEEYLRKVDDYTLAQAQKCFWDVISNTLYAASYEQKCNNSHWHTFLAKQTLTDAISLVSLTKYKHIKTYFADDFRITHTKELDCLAILECGDSNNRISNNVMHIVRRAVAYYGFRARRVEAPLENKSYIHLIRTNETILSNSL